MRPSTLPCFVLSALFLYGAAEESSCSGKPQPDSVSLLQSRRIEVEYSDADSDAVTSSQQNPTASKGAETIRGSLAMALLTRQNLVRRAMAHWSITLVLLFVVLGLTCLFLARSDWARLQREDHLESRVTGVLHPQKVPEGHGQSAGDAFPPEPESPGAVARLPCMRLSPFWYGRGAPVQAETAVEDMPPPLAKSNLPLAREVDLLTSKEALATAVATGGDIMLLAPNGALLMRATVRKIDNDLWLEVTMQVTDGSPSSMVRLTNREAGNQATFFPGTRKKTGPEVYGPDGGLYGIVEMTSGGAQLVSSTNGAPVLTLDGNVNAPDLTIRTKTGLELGKVGCRHTSFGDVSISVHSGTDLALVVSTVLSILLTARIGA